LIVFWQVFPEAPLLVAANRDERLDRPSAPPRLWPGQPVPILAPVDLQGQGTWIGLSARGLFAGITNRFGIPPDPTRRSRGQLVLEVLGAPDAKTALQHILRLDPGDTNRFHLVVADRLSAHFVFNDGQTLQPSDLPPGIHVLTERSFNPGGSLREERLVERLAALPRTATPDEHTLRGLLSEHAAEPFEGTCVHLPAHNYGTRSSTLLWRWADDRPPRFLHAEGPPCLQPYQDYSPEIAPWTAS
jgi:uncharacterized protein with NRDE domain